MIELLCSFSLLLSLCVSIVLNVCSFYARVLLVMSDGAFPSQNGDDNGIHGCCFFLLTGPLTHVTSVVKGKTDLPCDISPPVENDQASLVLFYKDDASPSIYT